MPPISTAEPSLSAGGACTSVIIAARRRLCRFALRPSGPDALGESGPDRRSRDSGLLGRGGGGRGRRGRVAGRAGQLLQRRGVFIRSAACAISGIWRGSARRPGSGTPSTCCVRTKASTTTGSNWTPANLRSSASACSLVSGVMRYGRAAVIASKASATWRMRASFGISSPISRSG